MKKIILITIIALFGINVQAQENAPGKVKKANASFDKKSYPKAIERYEKLNLSDLDLKRNLALSYWQRHNSVAAEPLFKEIVTTDGHSAEDVYNYASVLRSNKKYEASNEWMKKYAKMNISDSRGKEHLKNPNVHLELQKDKNQYSIHNLDINSEQQDFGVTFHGDKVIFASSREGVTPIYRRWNSNKLPFLDTYIASSLDNGQIANPTRFTKRVNKKYHEGPVAFNQAADFMIFTRNNYEEKALDKEVRLKLFSSNLVEGKWTKPEPLPFNSPDYSVGHASISKDGKTLYFASNMPGGIGGVDIYKATINKDDSYGTAVNLGERINTEGDEMFPFVHGKGEILFFSSNGHLGLGGQDVFLAELKENETIGKVMNLGVPVNSSRDDFSFILNEEQTKGYFSSNREGGKGSDDIYSFDLLKPFTFGKTIKGFARDKKGGLLAEVMIILEKTNTGELDSILTNSDGFYEFIVEPDQSFRLRGQKSNYFDGTNTTNTNTNEEVIIADLELEKDPGLSLYLLITEKETGAPLDNVKIILIDNMTGDSEVVLTPISGDYLKPITDKKLNDRGSYNLSLKKEGYLSKTVTYNMVFDREGKYKLNSELDLSLEPIQIGTDLSKIIDINPIYFDLGKYNIRPNAAIELDKIVKVMNENPIMVVELGSHTDSRGSTSSNQRLSDRRAKASAKYIADRITNPERISGKGYGESTPNMVDLTLDGENTKQELTEEFINTFKTKGDKEAFNKYHQLNRRTEFIIIKM
ncbi:MAG: outer membrane protein OmpA-like peptidoglycan-associated protein [Crocinitomix sp.]|jgi:outer membrane protein OmpA-like peptidoglycan-associated protein/tetratricopeptide (TPR) repeat protein